MIRRAPDPVRAEPPRGDRGDGDHAPRIRPRGAAAPHAVTIRPATTADLPTIIDLRLALLEEHRGNVIYARIRRDARARASRLFAAQLASTDEITFIAERDGEAVGVLRCMDARGYPLVEPAQYGYVSSVYVVPSARRAGILRAMLAEAERWCAARGLTEIRLHSVDGHPSSNAAWAALGFEVVEYLRRRPLGR